MSMETSQRRSSSKSSLVALSYASYWSAVLGSFRIGIFFKIRGSLGGWISSFCSGAGGDAFFLNPSAKAATSGNRQRGWTSPSSASAFESEVLPPDSSPPEGVPSRFGSKSLPLSWTGEGGRAGLLNPRSDFEVLALTVLLGMMDVFSVYSPAIDRVFDLVLSGFSSRWRLAVLPRRLPRPELAALLRASVGYAPLNGLPLSFLPLISLEIFPRLTPISMRSAISFLAAQAPSENSDPSSVSLSHGNSGDFSLEGLLRLFLFSS